MSRVYSVFRHFSQSPVSTLAVPSFGHEGSKPLSWSSFGVHSWRCSFADWCWHHHHLQRRSLSTTYRACACRAKINCTSVFNLDYLVAQPLQETYKYATFPDMTNPALLANCFIRTRFTPSQRCLICRTLNSYCPRVLFDLSLPLSLSLFLFLSLSLSFSISSANPRSI